MTMVPSSSTAALEEQLSPELRFTLREAMVELGITHPEWPQVATLLVFETIAVKRLARCIQAEERCSRERALMTSCVMLGVGCDAMRMRLYRASAVVATSA